MTRCHSCVAILDHTVAEITLNGENKFFVILFTTLNINRFCTENFMENILHILCNKHI